MRYILIFLLAVVHAWGEDGRVIIMRHGQAEHNVNDTYNANPNGPNYTPSHLTKEGEAQAIQTARDLLSQGLIAETVHRVYVSPLPRTRETAMILVKEGVISEKNIVIDERLIEVQVGKLEGKPIIRPWNEELTKLHGTETTEQIQERIGSFAKEHLNSEKNQNVLVITHAILAHELMKVCGAPRNEKIATGGAVVIALK